MSDGFRINKAYAQKYNTWRQKEELQKLKDKYGDDLEGSDSDSESEDDDAEALTAEVEKDWLRTLAALKGKDPKIYQKEVTFYHDNNTESSSDSNDKARKKKKKNKPVYLKDMQRKKILEEQGKMSDDSDNGDEPVSLRDKLTYYQEQEELRKNVTDAVGSDDSSSEEEFLIKKRKTEEQQIKEDEDFRQWLKGQKDDLREKQVGIELAPLKNYWDKPDLHSDEKFLRDYILNQRYKEPDENRIPTYDEIVEDDYDDFSEEEDLLIKQDNFERKYNFRFEEPEGLEIKTYPRSMENTLRKKDTKRAEKRKQVKDRKKLEKEKKKEELKQLKNLKKQEIVSKIQKLKMITGNDTLGFTEEEINEDFDPQKYDEMMKRCFDDSYYEEGEEETKPVYDLSDDEIQPESWDTWTGGDNQDNKGWEGEGHDPEQEYEPHVDDPDFNMDADYDPTQPRQKNKKKKKKGMKSKLSEALSTVKPVFDPNEKTFEQYLDEYYKLDYEDIIDDMPCRFRYRKSVPNSFGLTVDEILTAEERDLNAWVSLKKMSQYRTEEEELNDVHIYARKGKDMRKKQRLLPSLFQTDEDEDVLSDKQKSKGKKGKKRMNEETEENADELLIPKQKKTSVLPETVPSSNTESDQPKKKKNKKRGVNAGDTAAKNGNKESVENSPKKKKKKMHKAQLKEEISKPSKTDREKHKKEDSHFSEQTSGKPSNTEQTEANPNKNKERNKKRKAQKEKEKLKLSDERLKAYGINPKKYKYMKKEDLSFKHQDS